MDEQGAEVMDTGSSVDKNVQLSEQYKLQGNEAYKEKDYSKAKELYSLAIGCDSTNPLLYGNRAMTEILLEDYSSGLEDALTAVRLDDKFVKGYLRAGKCYLALGNVEQALTTYQKVLTFEAKNRAALEEIQMAEQLQRYKDLAEANFDRGEFRTALHYWTQCLTTAPNCLMFKTRKAETLAMMENYRDASILCNELLLKDRQNADALYVKGIIFYYQDVVDKAKACFQQVLRLNPDHKPSQLIIRKSKRLLLKKEEGNEAFKSNNLDNALSLYTEALDIDPYNKITNAKLYCNRALVYFKLGRAEDAVADATRAIELDDKYIKAYQRRAKWYQELNQHEEAVRDLEKLCNLERSRENQEILKEGKRLLKLSKRKDYYKILGVDKNAGESEIKKAYKKKALQFHPDRHSSGTEEEKQAAEHQFKEVGEAYSILTDPRKKRRYDSGQDLEEMGMGDFDPNQLFRTFFAGGGGFSFGGSPFSSFTDGAGGSTFQFSF